MRHRLLMAGSALVAQALAAQTPAPATVRFELPNGLRVWVQEDHTRPVVLVQTAYKVGAVNELPGTTGTAHYVEHMVYRATAHIRNEDSYGYIDRIGGRYTGGTSRDGTTYGETVPSWAFESALRTTAERMGHTVFDSLEFERERNNVVTEANGFSRSDPATALRDAVMLSSFELHPYRYSSTTWSQDNLAISRADAYEFYKRYYGPNNAVLSIVGDVTTAEARRLVTRHFGALARAPHSGAVSVVEPPQRAEKRVTLRAPVPRAQIDIVYRAPPAAHRDYPVLVALDRLLARRLQASLASVGGADLVTTHNATPYPFVYRLTASAATGADAERVVGTIQSEIERLAVEGITTDELTAARAEVVPQGRGRGGGGGAAAAGGVPPRQSNLTQIANQLSNRETFAWEVGAELRDRIRRAQMAVTPGEIRAYVDRWLRTSQRTVGLLVPAADDFMPAWSNDRALAGERLEIPPLTTSPAKRLRPDPVPARALEPLAAFPMQRDRRVLTNGVVVRAARDTAAVAAAYVRVTFGPSTDANEQSVAFLAARLIAGDSAVRTLGARLVTSALANDGYFDLRVNLPSANMRGALGALAHALTPAPFSSERIAAELARPAAEVGGGRGGGGGGGGRGGAVNADARTRVLGVVAPTWRSDPSAAALPSVAAADVDAFIARRLTGSAVTIAIVGPAAPSALVDLAAAALGGLPTGTRAAATSATSPVSASAPAEDRVPLASETQVTVLAGLPGVARDGRDRRALELLNYIVGVPSYGGRLGWALTKAGLTYSSAATTTFGASSGHILFSTRCDTRNLDATIQAIREVIAGVAERGVEPWEVREAQAFTFGRTLLNGPRDDSGPDPIAVALLDSESSGDDLLDLPAWSRSYLAVTPEQVNAAARRYYRSELLKVVAIGAIPRGQQRHIFLPGTFRALFDP